MNNLIYLYLLPFTVKANRLHSRVEANPVAEFEAIGKGLFRGVNAYHNTIEFVVLHTLCISISGKTVRFYWRVVKSGFLCSLWKCDMYLMRYLGCDFMKGKGRD